MILEDFQRLEAQAKRRQAGRLRSLAEAISVRTPPFAPEHMRPYYVAEGERLRGIAEALEMEAARG